MASATGGPSRKKTVHHLGSPFSSVPWPEISQEDQDTILEILCNYLNPIGQHRRVHLKPSKGKRAERKRKRQHKDAGQNDAAMAIGSPPMPGIASQVDVGFNSVTNFLQRSSADTRGNSAPAETRGDQYYSMIFVCRGNQSAAFNSHFPQMVAALSRDIDPDRQMRLVGLSKACTDRLGASLGVARVSCLAIRADAQGCETLWDFVRKAVKPLKCEWLAGEYGSNYRDSKIVSLETSVGIKKVKQVPAS